MKIKKGDKILLISPKNKRYIITADKNLFSTSEGNIDTGALIGKNFGLRMKTNTNSEFIITKPGFSDILYKSKKGPQAVVLKDSAIIAAHANIGLGSKVVDAGTGSGWLAAFLARLVGPTGNITSYEARKEFIDIAKKNLTNLGVNVKIKHKDVYKGITEKKLDVITLDLPEPWNVPTPEKNLKVGGYLVAYLPTITQVSQFEKELYKNNKLHLESVIEVIERPWVVKGRVVRPDNISIGHTAFLMFVRKIIS